MRVIAVAATATLALSLAPGCSLFSAQRPQHNRRVGQAPVCSTAHGSIAADGLAALVIGGLTISSGSDGALIGGLLTAAYAGSATYGYRATSACERARASYETEVVAAAQERGRARAKSAIEAASREEDPPPAPRPPVAPAASLPPTSGIADPYANDGTTTVATKPAASAAATPPATTKPAPAGVAAGPSTAVPDENDEADDGTTPEPGTASDTDTDTDTDTDARWRAFWRRLP